MQGKAGSSTGPGWAAGPLQFLDSHRQCFRVSLFSQETRVSTRGHRLRLCQGRLRLNIQKNFLTVSVVKHWNRLLRHVIESPFLKMFKCTWVYTAWWCLVKAWTQWFRSSFPTLMVLAIYDSKYAVSCQLPFLTLPNVSIGSAG